MIGSMVYAEFLSATMAVGISSSCISLFQMEILISFIGQWYFVLLIGMVSSAERLRDALHGRC